MEIFDIKIANQKTIAALGPESAGNFSIYRNKKAYFSENFGDLLDDANYRKFKNKLNKFLKTEHIKPNIILTDLHPLYKTTSLGAELSQKYKIRHIQIQHHLAHIFSSIGDKIIQDTKYKILNTTYGIALDGTGYGLDGKIWGGEIFKIKNQKSKIKKIERIGHLDNQILIGGELAIQQPARMLISILSKFLDKKDVFEFVKKYYSRNGLELFYNQLQQNFNCLETSSAGRILDAVSVLLGFARNVRKYKHEPIDLLEKNSTKPYLIKPAVVFDTKENLYILQTTPFFEFLIKNIKKDKNLSAEEAGRLAATAQLYIAEGLCKIICHSGLDPESSKKNLDSRLPAGQAGFRGNDNIFLAGGISNNKIISSYLESKGVYTNKKIPRGDAGLSFGQIIYFLLANPRN